MINIVTEKEFTRKPNALHEFDFLGKSNYKENVTVKVNPTCGCTGVQILVKTLHGDFVVQNTTSKNVASIAPNTEFKVSGSFDGKKGGTEFKTGTHTKAIKLFVFEDKKSVYDIKNAIEDKLLKFTINVI